MLLHGYFCTERFCKSKLIEYLSFEMFFRTDQLYTNWDEIWHKEKSGQKIMIFTFKKKTCA